VWAVLDYTRTSIIERELLLAKVSTLGPEYAQDQLSSSPTNSDSASFDRAIENQDHQNAPEFVAQSSKTPSDPKLEAENRLARTFESSGSAQPQSSSPLYPVRHDGLSASEALIAKNLHLSAIKTLADQFGGRVVDVAENSCIVELTAKSSRLDAFLSLIRPFGVLEAARSGESSPQFGDRFQC
jgi:acetolactate synthase-1/3 small subunit